MTTIAEIWHLNKQPGLIGIEVEMEGQNFVTPKGWEAKNDNSLRGNSIEWIFNRPVSLELARRRIERLYKYNLNSGAKLSPSPRCATHVHFNCQSLTSNQVFSLAFFWYIFEGMLVRWCGEDRECNTFCLRAEDAEEIVDNLAKGFRYNDLISIVANWGKYSGLNLGTLSKFGSAEFRSLKTPRDYEKIIKWLDILHTLYNFAINVENVREFIEGLSATGYKDVINGTFGELVGKEFNYPDLEYLILKSLRTVQFAIYSNGLPEKKPVKKRTRREVEEAILQNFNIVGPNIRLNVMRNVNDTTS